LNDFETVARIDAGVYGLHTNARPDLFSQESTGILDLATFENILRDANSAVLVADVEGDVVGYLSVTLEDLHSRFWSPHKSRAEIDQMGVLPAFQKQGIGRALMQAAEDWAKGRHATQIRLNVYHFNEPAQKAYAKNGYSIERLMMSKSLAGDAHV